MSPAPRTLRLVSGLAGIALVVAGAGSTGPQWGPLLGGAFAGASRVALDEWLVRRVDRRWWPFTVPASMLPGIMSLLAGTAHGTVGLPGDAQAVGALVVAAVAVGAALGAAQSTRTNPST